MGVTACNTEQVGVCHRLLGGFDTLLLLFTDSRQSVIVNTVAEEKGELLTGTSYSMSKFQISPSKIFLLSVFQYSIMLIDLIVNICVDTS